MSGDPLSVRIGYRLKFVDDHVAHRLLLEARDWIADRESGGDGVLGVQAVVDWLTTNEIKLMYWQKDKFRAMGAVVPDGD